MDWAQSDTHITDAALTSAASEVMTTSQPATHPFDAVGVWMIPTLDMKKIGNQGKRTYEIFALFEAACSHSMNIWKYVRKGCQKTGDDTEHTE